MKQVGWQELKSSNPEAASALWSEAVDIEETDLAIYLGNDGTLFCQSHDERDAWKWDASDKSWIQIDYPLNLASK